MKVVSKLLKVVFKIGTIVFAIIGLFAFNYHYRTFKANTIAENLDKKATYNDVFNFNENGGNPLFWVQSSKTRTVFFFGELNNPNPIGPYYNFLKHIYKYEGCNVIAPITGTQSSTAKLRTRGWTPKEDMREAIQLWYSYTSNLPSSHKLIIITQGTGSLCAAAIQAKASRKADEIIMMSPANAEIVNDDAPLGIRLAVTAGEFLSYFFPYMINSNYDSTKEYNDMYPEYNTWNFHNSFGDISNYEEQILPSVKKSSITLMWGEDDPMFHKSGYDRIARTLMDAGNKVKPVELKRTGYNVLAGDESKKAEKVIYSAIRNY